MKFAVTFALGGLLTISPVLAESTATITLTDHRFSPVEIHVRANEPTTALLINTDAVRIEFASTSLKVKKVLKGRSRGPMRWRALAPGRYPFTEEFHSETAHGFVIAD